MRPIISLFAVAALVGGALTAEAAPGSSARRDTPKVQGVVNLNQADFDQLTLLPGIGPVKARRIIEHRAKHPFRRIEELTRVKGFGRKSFGRLRSHLAVTGATTIQRIRSVEPAPVSSPTTPTGSAAQPRSGVIH